MKVLVVNAGSSSIKYQVMDMTDESVLAAATCLWALSLLPAQMLNKVKRELSPALSHKNKDMAVRDWLLILRSSFKWLLIQT